MGRRIVNALNYTYIEFHTKDKAKNINNVFTAEMLCFFCFSDLL